MRYNRFYKANNYLTETLYTQELADYAAGLRYEDIPAEVIERAKWIVLDTIGAALASVGTAEQKSIVKMALEGNGGEGGPARLWGDGRRVSAVNGALALGTMSDLMGWEDCSWTGYPAAAAVPCAWLAAEEKHRSGKDLLRAVVAGYEISQRISMAVQPNDQRWEKKGWGPTSWQIFAGIIPAAVLYGFDARKINQSIGMGCESSVMPTRYYLTTMSESGHYELGLRARDSFLIVKAVEKGIRNCLDALDESRCYRGIICGEDAANGDGDAIVSADESDVTWFTKDLGTRYLILDTMPREWPAGLWSQSCASAVRDAVDGCTLTPDKITEILVDPAVTEYMTDISDGFVSAMHAQHSVAFAAAAALMYPRKKDSWYLPETLASHELLALAKKVKAGTKIAEKDAMKAFRRGEIPPVKVTIRTEDNGEYTSCWNSHTNCGDEMYSAVEVEKRFRCRTGHVLSTAKTEAIIQGVSHIETCGDICELSEKLFG